MVYNTTVTVTTAGTRVAFAASRTMADWVLVQAEPGNAGNAFVGGSTVSSSVYDAVLPALGTVTYPAVAYCTGYDLSRMYADAANNGDKVHVTYFRR